MGALKYWDSGAGEWKYVAQGPKGDPGVNGDGDVTGPASATDNAIVRFDSTTGKLVQNSGITISDASGGLIEITSTDGFSDIDIQSGTGNLYVNGVIIVRTSETQTLTNKRIQPRVSSAASGNISPDMTADLYIRTGLTGTCEINAPTGTPVQGEKLMFRFKDNGTSRTLNWDGIYRAIGVTLPTATTIGKTLYVGAIYNSTDTKWDVIAVNEEA